MFNISEIFKDDSISLTELLYEYIKSVINNDYIFERNMQCVLKCK